MNSRAVGVAHSPEVSFPAERVRRVARKGKGKVFLVALLLVVSFLAFVATMLVHYPQKVDAFLNSDQPLESKHVVTTSK